MANLINVQISGTVVIDASRNISNLGNVTPSATNSYELGSSTPLAWKTIYLGSANQIRSASTIALRNIAGNADQAMTCARITASGDIIPSVGETYNISSSSVKLKKVFYGDLVFCEDFMIYSLDTTYNWYAAGTAPTISGVTGYRINGVLRCQSSTVLNNTSVIYSGSTGVANYAKNPVVEIRYASDNSTNMTFWLGVTDANTFPPTVGFVYITCANAGTPGQLINYNAAKASTALGATSTTVNNNANFHILRLEFSSASSNCVIYLDGTSRGTVPTANTPATDLMLFAGVQTTPANGATHSLYIDYFKIWQDR